MSEEKTPLVRLDIGNLRNDGLFNSFAMFDSYHVPSIGDKILYGTLYLVIDRQYEFDARIHDWIKVKITVIPFPH